MAAQLVRLYSTAVDNHGINAINIKPPNNAAM
jgi:hypothetical protein